MRKLTVAIVLISACLLSVNSNSQTNKTANKSTVPAKPVASKYGALAIDRSNGFYYGWSFDYGTLTEAEKKALDECRKKGGNCSVVLSWSGTGCAVYRTIDGRVGTAYGWGIAKTKSEADAIATNECVKRSNGKPAINHVWACNSANTGNLKVIKNEKPDNSQEGVIPFNDKESSGLKKGNKIILTSNRYYFQKELKKGELFLFALRGDDLYRYINPYCIVNKNGEPVKYGGEVFFEQVETFLKYNINKNENKDYEWGLVTVKDFLRKDKRFGASFHTNLEDEKEMEEAMVRWGDYPEEQRKYPDNFSNIYNDKIIYTDNAMIEKETRTGFYCMQQYRYSNFRTYFKTEFNNISIR